MHPLTAEPRPPVDSAADTPLPVGSAADTLLPVDTALAVALAVLLIAATATAAVFRLSPDGAHGRAREIVTAGLRATAQLVAVSLVIGWAVHHTAALLGFLFLMFAVATRTAGRRITDNRTWWWAALPIGAPVAPVIAGLVVADLLTVPGIAIVPVRHPHRRRSHRDRARRPPRPGRTRPAPR